MLKKFQKNSILNLLDYDRRAFILPGLSHNTFSYAEDLGSSFFWLISMLQADSLESYKYPQTSVIVAYNIKNPEKPCF